MIAYLTVITLWFACTSILLVDALLVLNRRNA